ncbi:MAG TPA: LysE family translocator [Hyphomicrobiales bacterium]|nr:LysE family translocator [Hyphomicrobiales bacterium]
MIEVSWWLFLLASLAVILAPGQDMVLVMSRGLGQGSSAGVVTAAGVSTGLLGHTILATFGLGALLMASELAFTVLKLIGAAYLIYLGARLILSGAKRLDLKAAAPLSRRRLFSEGTLSNLSNPKVTLFYFAFLPQFVSKSAAAPTLSIFVLGVAFSLLTFLIKGPVGFFAGSLSDWFRAHPGALAWMHRSSGLVLVGFGLLLAFEQRR